MQGEELAEPNHIQQAHILKVAIEFLFLAAKRSASAPHLDVFDKSARLAGGGVAVWHPSRPSALFRSP